jgi:histidine triad (HIT) family protein
MMDCLFCKIVSGDVPSDKVTETEDIVAFRDIAPVAPVHVQVITKAHYGTAAQLISADPALAGRMLTVAADVAKSEGLADSGYRLQFNTGADAGQEIPHVHLHVFGGRPLGPIVAS